MPNEFGQLSAVEALLLLADSQTGPHFDFRDIQDRLFGHLTNLEGAVTILKKEGREAVDRILLHPVIRGRILSFLKTGLYSAKIIADHIGAPYAEVHIQAILDFLLKENEVIRVVGLELPPKYTVQD